jgi:hypothetical protein
MNDYPHIMPIEAAATLGLIRLVGSDGTTGDWHQPRDRTLLDGHCAMADALFPGVVHSIEGQS